MCIKTYIYIWLCIYIYKYKWDTEHISGKWRFWQEHRTILDRASFRWIIGQEGKISWKMWRLFGQPSRCYQYSNTNLSCCVASRHVAQSIQVKYSDRNFDKGIVKLCTCSSELKEKDRAKYDEMYHAKSVLWISEITSSPKPLQYKENRTYSSVPCTEVSSLQCYPALQLLHSSEEPWQKLHFVLGSGTVDRQFIQLNPSENFNKTFWCLWKYFMISTA